MQTQIIRLTSGLLLTLALISLTGSELASGLPNSLPVPTSKPSENDTQANSKPIQIPISKQTKNTSNLQENHQASNCSNGTHPEIVECSTSEFSIILQKIVQNDDILRRFKEIENVSGNSNVSLSVSFDSTINIRPVCVRELFRIIKSLASNELELKTMLEFASDTPSINSKLTLANLKPSSFQQRTNAQPVTSGTPSGPRDEADLSPASKLKRLLSFGRASSANGQSNRLDFSHLRGLSQIDSSPVADGGCNESPKQLVTASQTDLTQLNSSPTTANEVEHSDSSGSKTLARALANVDQWILGLEKFTQTRQWAYMMKIFQGTETILSMFISKTSGPGKKSANSTAANNKTSHILDAIQGQLPEQVLTLTNSLNSLFPWHVWPWNNLDLYSTIDTFLNHGIFAFSKTTVGPERRIDHLSEMLQTLFKSLKYDSFPKKCNDWSRIICDREAFFDKLVVADPSGGSGELSKAESDERATKVRELAAGSQNQLTQELSCIMFSSLSMQHFGAKEDLEMITAERQQLLNANNNGRLPWDKQVNKALKLYSLSREALTDDQWLALYGLINDLWAQQKVSDRVIMVGRVIQLITNCHMPREMLESALWKDIYKYKNVLNQLVDVVTEELTRSSETGKLTIDQISLGSKGMHEIIGKFLTILPKLIESLSQTIVDQLPDLVNRFFADKAAFFRAPCKGYSFSDIIPSLTRYGPQIIEIEELVCRQLKTKPNITMSQFNNMMSNDFFAIAFNFTNYRYIQKMLEMEPSAPEEPAAAAATAVGGKLVELSNQLNAGSPTGRASLKVKRSDLVEPEVAPIPSNLSSVVDEMAANPRLAQIVAILQSSSLDPPEVHAELPELNWVEAGTSVALLYEAIQKLLSYEQPFNIFPEVPNFQEELMGGVESSRQMFVKFSKRDPLRLIAYSLDTVMPIALRTYKPMDSFHLECSASLRDIFSEDTLAIESQQQVAGQQQRSGSRQWQCFVSSMNFAGWATNNFMRTFNSMFRNVLAHKSLAGPLRLVAHDRNATSNSSCIFFDGSVSAMLDNLPQFIDLSLETVLMASTSLDQQLSLYEVMCSSNYTLDPFNDRARELKTQMKDKMCHLFHKKSLENCASVLELQQWTSTMRELNTTWFEVSPLSLTPSFRNITVSAHEFLELFGQFRPSTMSDSLLARVLNVNSFWTNLLNRTMSIIDKYQEKRFEFALQTLTPIIYDNLPIDEQEQQPAANVSDATTSSSAELRETLTTSILGAKAILSYLMEKQSNATGGSQLDAQLQILFGWADRYSMSTAETLLRTLASNITKLETMFTGEPKRLTGSAVWVRFCAAPAEQFLYVLDSQTNSTLEAAKLEICQFKWQALYQQLKGSDSDNLKRVLAPFPVRELTRIALTKWGQALDLMFIESKSNKQLPKLFYMQHWDGFRSKLPQISPLKNQPSNLSWIWQGVERIVRAIDDGSTQRNHQSLVRILDQLNCGLEAVKGGLSWENIANIYSDKQDILAAHSTINNGFALASIGLNTFLAHKKFQKLLDEFVKPRVGLTAFCEFRDRRQLESIFFIPEGQDFIQALESFQELICDTNFDTLAQNINPISVCYQTPGSGGLTEQEKKEDWPLADGLDRFFKLVSLAVLDAKLVATSDAKPPILDKDQWANFWSWWRGAGSGISAGPTLEPEARKARIALALVRAFQTIDSINADHVVWMALFRSIHEVSEVTAYLLRAVERRNQESQVETELGSRLSMVKEAASKIDTALKNPTVGANSSSFEQQQQQLASTLSNIMFPEVNNFISFRTFKQLRYIKTISDYFTQTVGAQALVCRSNNSSELPEYQQEAGNSSSSKQQVVELARSRLELINYKLNSNEKLFKLLCQYEPSQWLTALNIVISTRTNSIPKKVNYMTKYLSIFTRQYRARVTNEAAAGADQLDSFIHGQQLENIEFVANTTVSYILATSQSIKSLSFSKISDISWHSLPNILDSIDRHLCASKYELGTFRMPQYEPKKLELETIVCKLPHWNITQVYNYVNENFDLQNMISLISASQQQQFSNSSSSSAGSSLPVSSGGSPAGTGKSLEALKNPEEKICITPFKFASKWLKIVQETVDEFMSKASKEKIKRCRNQSRKGQSAYTQALRYIRYANSLLSSVDELTQNNSWPAVKKSWASISYLLLNQSAQGFA